ncbi:MAG: PilZ domain-containing protein [Deltaproteobacteria bacterium]|nr:PilZ domain-containing protein [Deltaproteobacteria bacterium]MBW2393058.1 PilZ domain-containing protein [Deltaproteobacteria bacterium]
MDDHPFTLILDDASTGLGRAALRLLRMGIDVFYAADPDEAVLFCRQAEAGGVRAVMLPEELDLAILGRVLPRLPANRDGSITSLVAVGELADEKRLAELRKAGVDRVLRTPFDDSALRWMANEARFEHEHQPKRRFSRAPTDLLCRASWGIRRKDLVCSTLSKGGAFLETPSPLEIGQKIKLRIPLPDGPVSLKCVVANHAVGASLRPSGMGVTFLEPATGEDPLSSFVTARLAEFLL